MVRSVGALLVVLSALGFAMSSIIVRSAADAGLATLAITFYVGLVRFAMCLLFVLLRGDVRKRALCAGHGWDFVALCVFRQALGAVSILGAFAAFAKIPIGNATVLLFTSPVWTTAMAFCWLGEPITRTGQIAAVFVCAGVALVAHASASGDGDGVAPDGVAVDATAAVVGTALALVASLSDAAFLVATRAIGPRQGSVPLTMWMGFSISASTGPLCVLMGIPIAPGSVASRTLLILFAGGIASLLANVALNCGLEKLEAAPANVLGALQVPIAYVLQLAIMHQAATPSATFGAAVIVVCALLVTLAKGEPAPSLASAAPGDVEGDAQPLLGARRDSPHHATGGVAVQSRPAWPAAALEHME